MDYIIVKNNSAVKYVATVEDYIHYVINQYTINIYMPVPIDIEDAKYNDGLYII